MMKKILLLTLCCMLFVGCSSNTETLNKDSVDLKNDEVIDKVIETKKDEKVKIIMTMYDFGTGLDIQTYVDEQNAKNETDYKVYDDTHYVIEITEQERLDTINKFYSEEGKMEFLASFDESCPGTFTYLDFEDNGKTILLYADSSLYKDSLSAAFAAIISCSLWSDICQSYNLVPIEERSFYLKVVDKETNDLLYEYPEE